MLEPPNTHVFSLVMWQARDVLMMLLGKSRQGGGDKTDSPHACSFSVFPQCCSYLACVRRHQTKVIKCNSHLVIRGHQTPSLSLSAPPTPSPSVSPSVNG